MDDRASALGRPPSARTMDETAKQHQTPLPKTRGKMKRTRDEGTNASLGRWTKRLNNFRLHERLEGRPRFRARKTAQLTDRWKKRLNTVLCSTFNVEPRTSFICSLFNGHARNGNDGRRMNRCPDYNKLVNSSMLIPACRIIARRVPRSNSL